MSNTADSQHSANIYFALLQHPELSPLRYDKRSVELFVGNVRDHVTDQNVLVSFTKRVTKYTLTLNGRPKELGIYMVSLLKGQRLTISRIHQPAIKNSGNPRT